MTPLLATWLLLSATPATPRASPPPTPPPSRRVLTLEEAVRTAHSNQPRLRQASAGTSAAQARADQARSSLLPQLSGFANYQRATSNYAVRSGGGDGSAGTSLKMSNSYTFGASASQLIWDFGATSDRWRAAQASTDAQKETERYTELQVLLGVRSTYFTARAAKDLVAVARETLKNEGAHLAQTQGFVEVGTRPEIDLAQVRTNVANARVQLINAENSYETAKLQLNQAMGVEESTDYDVAGNAPLQVEGEDLTGDALLQRALSHRSDLRSMEQQVRSQQLTSSSVQGSYWPSLGVSAGVSNSGPELDQTAWNWNVTASLSWSFFQGGLTRARVQESEANLISLQSQISILRQQIRLEVEQARLAVRAAKSSLSAAGEAVINARERLRLAEGRYQVGAGSILELSDAQVAATAASAQKVQADFNLAIARAQLLQALGELGP